MALKPLALLALTVSLAACDVPSQTGFGGFAGFPASAPAAPPVPSLPPAVLAALPAGMSPEFATKGGDNCWYVVLEQVEPLTGTPLLDVTGAQVCDTGFF